MTTHRLQAVGLVVLLEIATPVGGQTESQSGQDAILRVHGEVETPLSLSAVELQGMGRETVNVVDHERQEAEFSGARLAEILLRAGDPMGDGLRGEALATYVVVGARDGERVVFSVAELGAAFGDRGALLAHQRDGKPLEAPEGPLRIVVPGESRHGRWIRMVETIEVRRAAPEGR